MKVFLETVLISPLILAITIVLFLSESITTFDVRVLQAKRRGALPANQPVLPQWVAILHWLNWGMIITLLVLNWKYAIGLVTLLFVLKILPVLETIGNMLMAPFRPKGPNKADTGDT